MDVFNTAVTPVKSTKETPVVTPEPKVNQATPDRSADSDDVPPAETTETTTATTTTTPTTVESDTASALTETDTNTDTESNTSSQTSLELVVPSKARSLSETKVSQSNPPSGILSRDNSAQQIEVLQTHHQSVTAPVPAPARPTENENSSNDSEDNQNNNKETDTTTDVGDQTDDHSAANISITLRNTAKVERVDDEGVVIDDLGDDEDHHHAEEEEDALPVPGRYALLRSDFGLDNDMETVGTCRAQTLLCAVHVHTLICAALFTKKFDACYRW